MLPRNRDQVAKDVIEMRQRMLDGHPNSTDLFDVKHDRGGMVDVEFIVQMLVLTFSHDYPELTNNFGNTLLTEMAARLGLIPENLAEQVVNAYRHYRNIQREIRLSRGEEVRCRVALDDVKDDRTAVLQLWALVFGTDAPQPKKA